MTRYTHAEIAVDKVDWAPARTIFTKHPEGLLEDLGAEVKLLSEDAGTGSVTCMVRLPAGAAIKQALTWVSDNQILLLEGDLTVDGETLNAPAYWFRPAGVPAAGVSTTGGAVMARYFKASRGVELGEA